MFLSLRNILLFSIVLVPTLAVPTSESLDTFYHEQRIGHRSSHRTPFQKLRDSLVEKIWNVPKKTEGNKSDVRLGETAPANLRDKYGKDVVLRFKIVTEDEAKAFFEAASILYLDIWDSSSNWVDVRIAKAMLPSFLNLLPSSLQNSHTPLMHDLAQAVYDTFPSTSDSTPWRSRQNQINKQHADLFFQDYQPLSVINAWLKLMASFFPDHAEVITIGRSAEGRNILGMRFSAPLQEQPPDDEVRGRQTILVVGGSHAREWISTSTVNYLIYSYATRYGHRHSPTITDFLKYYDVVFIPVLNPDGYEYTWSNDRLWRKNRQSTSLPFCPGIDLDRAYDAHWDGAKEVDNPCTETYAGEYAFQAIESKVLADWAFSQTRDRSAVFTAYFDLHSYSQKVLYPFSYSCDAKPANLENLQEVAFGLAKSFRTINNHHYEVSSACESQFSLYPSNDGNKVKSYLSEINEKGGSSLDYFYDILRVKHAYQIKLRDTGSYGFLLPKDNIVPSGREMFGAMLSFSRWILGERGIEIVDVDEETPEQSVIADDEMLVRPVQTLNHDTVDEDDDEEWERVYDEELRRRRR